MATQDGKPLLKAEAAKTSGRTAKETASSGALPKPQEDMTRSDAIARLDAALAKEYESYQQYPRREYVARNTQGPHKKYVADCINKIDSLPQSTLQQLNKYHITRPAQVTFSIEQSGMI